MHARITSSIGRARRFGNENLIITKESKRVFHGRKKGRRRFFENPENQGKERWRLAKKGILGFRAFIWDKGFLPESLVCKKRNLIFFFFQKPRKIGTAQTSETGYKPVMETQ